MACQTPGAVFHTEIKPRTVAVRVDLPRPLNLTATQAAAVEGQLHDHVESVLAAFFPGPSCIGHCADGHVCEDHPDMPWPHTACDAAGMPCPDRECRANA